VSFHFRLNCDPNQFEFLRDSSSLKTEIHLAKLHGIERSPSVERANLLSLSDIPIQNSLLRVRVKVEAKRFVLSHFNYSERSGKLFPLLGIESQISNKISLLFKLTEIKPSIPPILSYARKIDPAP